MKSIRSKLMLLVVASILSLSLLIGGISTVTLKKTTDAQIAQMDTLLRTDYDNSIKTAVEAVSASLNHVKKEIDSGAITRQHGEVMAADIIRSAVYGSDGYFWADTLDGMNIVNQGNKEIEGKSRISAADSNGVRFIEEFSRLAQTSGEGFLNYNFPKPGETEALPKRGYVKLDRYFNWTIGTGNYVDDMDKVIAAQKATADANLRKNIIVLVGTVLAVAAAMTVMLSLFLTRTVTKPLTRAIDDLNSSSDQIVSASGQLSGASQNLAEGSSEQASSIEEVSATIAESASMIKQSTDSAIQAAGLATQANDASLKGSQEMSDMMVSMTEIQKSSSEIAKIIKVIDEIAFQTNILALNAAVEAARAGEAGLGFAVVAEEVRNLAQRSAQAAKDTAGIIESNIELSVKGADASSRVNDSLTDINNKIEKVNQLISEVAAASQEQALGVDQISTAMNQMEMVTQQNASTAEESAAAAEELNSQAGYLLDVVTQLMVMTNGSAQMKGKPVKEARRTPILSKASPRAAMKSVAALPKAKSHVGGFATAHASQSHSGFQGDYRPRSPEEEIPFDNEEDF